MWDDLPRGVQLIVADYSGDVLIRRNRLHKFVLFELTCLLLIHHQCGTRLRPAVIPRVYGFKQTLELAYLQSKMKSRAERGIP